MNSLNNISQEQLEAIERYLNGNATPEERLEFDSKLNDDPVFRQLVEDVKEMIAGIEFAALKSQLNSFHEEIIHGKELENKTVTNKSKSKTPALLFAIAASVILALGLFWFMNRPSEVEKLFATHFTPDPGLPTTMGTSENYEFYDGMVNYKRKEYSEAIKKWEELYRKNAKNDTLSYFLGVAYLAEGNAEKSIFHLNEAQQSNESIFKEDAVFYNALAHLRKGNIEEAKTLLKKYPSERNEELLNDLNEN